MHTVRNKVVSLIVWKGNYFEHMIAIVFPFRHSRPFQRAVIPYHVHSKKPSTLSTTITPMAFVEVHNPTSSHARAQPSLTSASGTVMTSRTPMKEVGVFHLIPPVEQLLTFVWSKHLEGTSENSFARRLSNAEWLNPMISTFILSCDNWNRLLFEAPILEHD